MKVKACWNEYIDGVQYMVCEDGNIYKQKQDDPRPSQAVFICKRAKRWLDSQLINYIKT